MKPIVNPPLADNQNEKLDVYHTMRVKVLSKLFILSPNNVISRIKSISPLILPKSYASLLSANIFYEIFPEGWFFHIVLEISNENTTSIPPPSKSKS